MGVRIHLHHEPPSTAAEQACLLCLLVRGGETLFVKGNATFQNSETTAGVSAEAPTNNVRPASGAADYVINFTLGHDRQDGRHMGAIMFNVFGERFYTAGRNGA